MNRSAPTQNSQQQYELLKEYAQEINEPLGTLIREAVEQSLIIDLERRRKQKAVERIDPRDFGGRLDNP